MTGAPMPPGADAVVMVERTAPATDEARWSISLEVDVPGRHVRPAGDDVRAGRPGRSPPATVLTAGHLGVLASVGRTRGAGRAAGRVVGVLSTGDELVDDGRPARPGPDPRLQPADAAGPARRQRLRGGRPRAGRRRRGRDRPRRSRDGVGELRRARHQRRREHGRLRLREGRARPRRRHALDADRHQAGQAVRLRDVVEPTGTSRSSGCPGNPVSSMVSLRAVRPPGAAADGRPSRRSTGRRVRRGRRRATSRRRPDGKIHFVRVGVARWSVDRGAYARPVGGRPGLATSSPPWPRADALAVLPDGDGVGRRRAGRRASCST